MTGRGTHCDLQRATGVSWKRTLGEDKRKARRSVIVRVDPATQKNAGEKEA